MSAQLKQVDSTGNEAAKLVEQWFGEHPRDVIDPLEAVSVMASQIREILVTIERESLEGSRIHRLAGGGAFLAEEAAGFASRQHGAMLECLQDAGIMPVKQGDSEEWRVP